MTTNAISAWRTSIAKAAEADEMKLLREHLRWLDLPDQPELLLQGTLAMVPVTIAYRSIDGRDAQGLLDMQTYDPARATKASYALTFDLFGQAFGRILVDQSLHECDLADMLDAVWLDLEICGYRSFYITRTDGQALATVEAAALEELVRDDLYFDYSEDELAVWFDDSRSRDYLYVDVREIDDQLPE
ncbi:MAG: hypothetical protein WD049_08635 [Candidatus Paceibacterota bacterium]